MAQAGGFAACVGHCPKSLRLKHSPAPTISETDRTNILYDKAMFDRRAATARALPRKDWPRASLRPNHPAAGAGRGGHRLSPRIYCRPAVDGGGRSKMSKPRTNDKTQRDPDALFYGGQFTTEELALVAAFVSEPTLD